MPRELAPEAFLPPRHRRGLFYSRAWTESWLQAYGDHPGIRLNTAQGFYHYRHRLKRLLPIRGAALIGATSPALRSIRAEYATLDPDQHQALRESLNERWDMMAIPDILVGSDDERVLEALGREFGLVVEKSAREFAYAIDLRRGNFEDYLQRLGPNTRLKLYNRRQRLAEYGTVRLDNLWPDIDRFCELINGFHQRRWGKPCYAGRRRRFIDALLQGLDRDGQRVELSVLSVDDQPVSTTLDITINGRCYNLQSGFDPDWKSYGLSLGSLHFGYRIEEAFRNGDEIYDLMAGQGKRHNYKSAMADIFCPLITINLIRHPLLKMLYGTLKR